MSRLLQVLLVFTLVAGLLGPAWAAPVVLPPPAPAPLVPAWTVVPGSPYVSYAANIPGDCFFFKKRYYYYYQGYWYRSPSLAGPWYPVRKPPRAILMVPSSLFKTVPPPW